MTFQLLETMRVTPHGIYLLDRHLQRLCESAAYFAFRCDPASLRTAIEKTEAPCRLRLLLSPDGEYECDRGPLPVRNPERLRLSPIRVNSSDPFLYHKTTRRDIYGAAGPEALLMNERDEITETGIANVAVLRGGKWVTPRTACGLLPGVMRAELLDTGEIVEGVVSCADLRAGETIRCFNALRGVFDARFEAR